MFIMVDINHISGIKGFDMSLTIYKYMPKYYTSTLWPSKCTRNVLCEKNSVTKPIHTTTTSYTKIFVILVGLQFYQHVIINMTFLL